MMHRKGRKYIEETLAVINSVEVLANNKFDKINAVPLDRGLVNPRNPPSVSLCRAIDYPEPLKVPG